MSILLQMVLTLDKEEISLLYFVSNVICYLFLERVYQVSFWYLVLLCPSTCIVL